MARKKAAEDHVNHEAWAIPYGDLITLLLAFFVVMYSMSSVNEGKYRILSDSLVAAFRGEPMTTKPIQIGDKKLKALQQGSTTGVDPSQMLLLPPSEGETTGGDPDGESVGIGSVLEEKQENSLLLQQISDEVESAMRPLIEEELVRVKRKNSWIEIEIDTDILFPSGRAGVESAAVPVLQKIAQILRPFPNPIRVEGHTDNKPIKTNRFPSNWELSAARAARVVRLFAESGVEPDRLMVTGLGEHRPVGDNTTESGRNMNRRVVLVVLEDLGSSPAYDNRHLSRTEEPSSDDEGEDDVQDPVPDTTGEAAA